MATLNNLIHFLFRPPQPRIPYAPSVKTMLRDSLTERLPYWDLEDGIVFLKAGGMEFGVQLEVPSTLFYFEQDLENAWKTFKTVLRMGVPVGCRARLITECVPSSAQPVDAYVAQNLSGDAVLDEVLEARRSLLEQFQHGGGSRAWRFFLTIHVPTVKVQGHWTYSPLEMEKYRKAARELRERLVQQFAAARFTATSLGSQDTFELGWKVVTKKY